MTKKQKALAAVNALKEKYPDALCSLESDNPLQLLIATRLSAQCTDARVNLVTPALFEKYKTAEDFANADVADIEQHINIRRAFGYASESVPENIGSVAESIRVGVGVRNYDAVQFKPVLFGRVGLYGSDYVGKKTQYR